MAIFALLAGDFPKRAVATLLEGGDGATVAEVIEAERPLMVSLGLGID